MKKVLLPVALLLVGLTACNVSLAADVTPPPDYRPPSPVAQVTSQVVYPIVPPDPLQGASIYVEKCQPCHGPSGMGDGPQASQLPNPVTPVGDAARARLARPVDWFNVVTNGRLERFMPGFKSLSDRQRWDVIAFVYTLSAPAQVLDQGKAIYVEKCQNCHGPQGKGDGSAAATLSSKVPGWGDPARLAQRSGQELAQLTGNGVPPSMPAFGSQLSDDQRWAVVAYIRSLTFANPIGQASSNVAPTATAGSATPTPGRPVAAATTTAAVSETVVRGKVTNSSGGPVPAGLQVNLQGYDNMQASTSATAKVEADGTYRFDKVEVISGRVFLASVEYNSVTFNSPPVHASTIKPGEDVVMDISLAESTSDISALVVDRLHLFLNFAVAGKLQVAELFIISNPTDKAIAPADSKDPPLKFELPQGAENLQFEDSVIGERYVKTEKGFGDLQSISPQGSSQVLFAYDLTYQNQATLSIPLNLPVNAVVVMAPSSGVKVESALLKSAGNRTVDGSELQLLAGSNLAAGSKLELVISGQPDITGTTATTAGTNSQSTLFLGLGIFALVLVVVGFWLYRQNRARQPEETPADQEKPEDAMAVLDAIVALDDLYQAGDLPEEAYRQRRAELKEKLKQIKSQ